MTGIKKMTPRDLLVKVSLLLILGGLLFLIQPFSFTVYQVGFCFLMVGAYLQIIMGNLPKTATYMDALKNFLIGTLVFLGIVGIAIWFAPILAMRL